MATCLTAKGYCHGFGDNKNCYGNEMSKFQELQTRKWSIQQTIYLLSGDWGWIQVSSEEKLDL